MKSVVLTLVVYSYSSLISQWGVGPEIKTRFEKQCGCQVKFVDVGGAGGLVSRLKLEKSKTTADVVLGADETQVFQIQNGLKLEIRPEGFDSAPYAFVYNSEVVQKPPQSLDDLLKPEWKNEILLEDPRLSTPGLGFLLWVHKAKKDQAWDYLKKLKPQVKTISPNWSLAYGMFKKGKGKLVLSYWTSPAYHKHEEKTDKYKAAKFSDGHYSQREYVFIMPQTQKKDLAQKFTTFLKSDEVQGLIPLKQYMYPAQRIDLPQVFKELGVVRELNPYEFKSADELSKILQKWREIFSQ